MKVTVDLRPGLDEVTQVEGAAMLAVVLEELPDPDRPLMYADAGVCILRTVRADAAAVLLGTLLAWVVHECPAGTVAAAVAYSRNIDCETPQFRRQFPCEG